MNAATTIAFYTDTDTKSLLEQWAREDDRSVSSVIRQCIEKERQRRLELPADQALRRLGAKELFPTAQ